MTQRDDGITTTRERGWGLAIAPIAAVFGALVLGLYLAFMAAPLVSAAFMVVIIGLAVAVAVDSRMLVRGLAKQNADVAVAVAQSVRGQAPQVIEHDARPQPTLIAAPPRAMLPAPERITAVRMKSGGEWSPMAARRVPVVETTTGPDEAGQFGALSVPLNYLQRFAALKTPSRAEWTGKREIYTQCAEWFSAQGVLRRAPNNGYAWHPEYPLESRREWLESMEVPA